MKMSTPIATAVAALFVAGSAFAQSDRSSVRLPALDVERFRLNAGAEESLIVQTGMLLPQGDARLSVSTQYAQGTAVTRVGEGYGDLRLGSRAMAHLTAAYAFSKWLQADVSVPLILFQNEGEALAQKGFAPVSSSGFGSPLLTLRSGILRQSEGMPVNLALSASFGVPIGDAAALARDPQPTSILAAAVGRDLGYAKVGGQLALRMHSLENFSYRGLSTNEADTVDHELHVGLSGLRQFMPKLSGEVGLLTDVSLKNVGVSVQPFVGARYELTKETEAFVGAGPAFGSLVGTAQFRAMAGLAYRGGMK